MTFASLAIHSNPAHAETEFCIVASNGKTICGKGKGIERMCVSTDGNNTICGKFKSIREEQAQEEARTPAPNSGYRKEVNNFLLTLESCRHIDRAVLCQMKIFNKGKRRNISIASRSSILVDSSGNSYPSYGTDFGGGPGSSKAEIDSNTDIIVGISFGNNDISKQVVKAQILNLVFEEPLKPIQFRNVPISN
ncbi:hypothetical protein [Chamaesiphon sp.]|uniref:hypothetical protein n=1 Tax=Chamaesiphon sp. TaxID=2814140 RepID=UPI0035942A5C